MIIHRPDKEKYPDSFNKRQHFVEKKSLSTFDRRRRRLALTNIFDELNAADTASRKFVIQSLVEPISHYQNCTSRLVGKSESEQIKFYKEAEKHASGLLKLMKQDLVLFGTTLIENADHELDEASNPEQIFAEIAALAKRYSKNPPETLAFHALVGMMAQLYQHCTRRNAGLSRDARTQSPSGPFFRMLGFVCDLFEIDKTDEAIANAIRRAKKQKCRWPDKL